MKIKTNRYAYTTALALGAASLLAASAVAHADTIYVSSAGNRIIEEYTSGGAGSVFATAPQHPLPLLYPTGLALDSAGNLYASVGNLVMMYTPSGVGSVFADMTRFGEPTGLAFDGAGTLYVGCQSGPGSSTVVALASDGTLSSRRITTRFDQPCALAFDNFGNLYVSDSGISMYSSTDCTITKITPGGVVSTFATGLGTPTGLAFDNAGNLYVSASAASAGPAILKITPDGTTSVFAQTGLSAPWGLAFDSAGDLYVANEGNGTVMKFTPDGAGSTFASGLSNPEYIAILVPEPSALALVLLGLPALVLRFGALSRGRGGNLRRSLWPQA